MIDTPTTNRYIDINNTDRPIKDPTPISPIVGNIIMINPKIIASKLINLVFIIAS
jgi:hypothetical protein